MKSPLPNLLAQRLRSFFEEYLVQLRSMSPHTILSYRDSLILLLRFVSSQRGQPVSNLDLQHIGTDQIIAFLNHLETRRHNTATTRNVRLAAIHAFFKYVASEHPDRLEYCQRILSIPFKRTSSKPVEYLEIAEVDALLSVVDRTTRSGRRDYALIATMFNTGGRVSEILGIRAKDLQFNRPYHVRLFGKGRKERFCPLWPQTAQLLREFCRERGIDERGEQSLFLNHRGQPLSRYGVRYILAKHVKSAQAKVVTLAGKKISPHGMRHTTAVHLLKAGVDLSTISHWLGHARINSTNKYTAIDLEAKREAIGRMKPLRSFRKGCPAWRKNVGILDWLESL